MGEQAESRPVTRMQVGKWGVDERAGCSRASKQGCRQVTKHGVDGQVGCRQVKEVETCQGIT